MTEMILVYITCKNVKQAKAIGTHLLQKRLAGCINIFPKIHSLYFWPPKSRKIESANETVILVKTIKSKYKTIESEVHKVHTFQTPAIFAIPLLDMERKYLTWLTNEIV